MKFRKPIVMSLSLMVALALSCFAFVAAAGTAQSDDAAVTIWWEYDSTPTEISYGSWSAGDSGSGPCTIEYSIDPHEGLRISFTIGGSKSDFETPPASHCQVQVPAGKHYTILYRTMYQNYSVTETQYRMVIATGEKTVLQRKTGTAKEAIGIDFGYRDDATQIIY